MSFACQNLALVSHYDLPFHLIVLVLEINMFVMKRKLRMELKCHCCDVANFDIVNVFYQLLVELSTITTYTFFS